MKIISVMLLGDLYKSQSAACYFLLLTNVFRTIESLIEGRRCVMLYLVNVEFEFLMSIEYPLINWCMFVCVCVSALKHQWMVFIV
jgi:hypothetical protein